MVTVISWSQTFSIPTLSECYLMLDKIPTNLLECNKYIIQGGVALQGIVWDKSEFTRIRHFLQLCFNHDIIIVFSPTILINLSTKWLFKLLGTSTTTTLTLPYLRFLCYKHPSHTLWLTANLFSSRQSLWHKILTFSLSENANWPAEYFQKCFRFRESAV